MAACIGNWEQADEQIKLVKDLLQNYKGRHLSKEEVSKRAHLSIQSALLEILQSGDIEIKALNDLKGLVTVEAFSKDIQACVKLFEDSLKSQKDSDMYKVLDTDDPNHFLLMGTEVEESCQNVNGDANLNKCYLVIF